MQVIINQSIYGSHSLFIKCPKPEFLLLAKRSRPITRDHTSYAQTSRVSEDDYDDDDMEFKGHDAKINEDEDEEHGGEGGEDDVDMTKKIDEDDDDDLKMNDIISQDIYRNSRISQNAKHRPRLSPSADQKELSGGTNGQSNDRKYKRNMVRPDSPRAKKWDNPAVCINNCLDNSSMTFVRCKSMCT